MCCSGYATCSIIISRDMNDCLGVPHESGVMSMWKGICGILNNVSCTNIIVRP